MTLLYPNCFASSATTVSLWKSCSFAIVLSNKLNEFAVRLKETNFLTVFCTETNAISFTRCRVNYRNIRNVNGCFFLNNTASFTQLWVRLLVFLDKIYTFNDYTVIRIKNTHDFALLAFIFTR